MKAGIDKMTGYFSVTVYGTFILLNKDAHLTMTFTALNPIM